MSSRPHLFDGTGSPQSVYQTSTTQRHPIGARGVFDDGRVFHYARSNEAVAIPVATLVQACVPVALHVTQTSLPTGLAAANTSDSLKTIAATLGATAAYANEYEGGQLKIESATTGAGQSFTVGKHAAVLASGVLTFQTKDPVNVLVNADSVWSLIHNPWGSVVVQPAAVTAPTVGVTLCAWAATADTSNPIFGWVQTWGLASVLSDNSAFVAGHTISSENNATVGAAAVSVEGDIVQRVGVSMEAITTTGYANVFLQIAP